MGFIFTVESGYLKLLRVVFLIIATIALIVAVALGIKAFIDYRARPIAVSERIDINPAAYKLPPLPSDNTATENKGDAKEPVVSETDSLPDKLVLQWRTMLDGQLMKIIGPDWHAKPDQPELRNYYSTLLRDPRYGQEYIDKLRNYVDAVLSRADVIKYINKSHDTFDKVVDDSTKNFWSMYNAQKNQIEAEKKAAQDAALEKKLSAIGSLPALGSLIGIFVVLVLLLILFRVEYSIREIAAVHQRGLGTDKV